MGMSFIEPHRAQVPGFALPELARHKLRLVFDQVRSAHNVGAMFRTADAAAIESLYLIGITPHPPHGQVEKTSLGATNYIEWKHMETFQSAAEELESDGYELVALENTEDAQDLWEFQWPERSALIAGSETDGLSEETLARCKWKLNVPMFGYKRSLNVTTAVGLALYDYVRHWRDSEKGAD